MYTSDSGSCHSSTAVGTSHFTLFCDKLFDSFNGSAINPTNGKLLRCAVKQNSPHHEFWAESLKVLKSMTFVAKNGKRHIPPTVKNWTRTIRGRYYMFQKNFK